MILQQKMVALAGKKIDGTVLATVVQKFMHIENFLSSHMYADAHKLAQQILAIWPAKQQVIISEKHYDALMPKSLLTTYPLLFKCIAKPTHVFSRQAYMQISTEKLQKMVDVFAAAARIQDILSYSQNHLQQDLLDLQRMISMSAYDIEIVLQLPENMAGLKATVRSFYRLNEDPTIGVSVAKDGQSIRFKYGLDAGLIRNLQAVFNRRPDQKYYLDTFIEKFTGVDPRVQCVQLNPENILTGLRVCHDRIRDLLSQHFVPLPLVTLVTNHGFSFAIRDAQGAAYVYNESQVLDHNMNIASKLGDSDIFKYYAQSMFERYLSDPEITAAQREAIEIQNISNQGVRQLQAIVAEAADRAQAFPYRYSARRP